MKTNKKIKYQPMTLVVDIDNQLNNFNHFNGFLFAIMFSREMVGGELMPIIRRNLKRRPVKVMESGGQEFFFKKVYFSVDLL